MQVVKISKIYKNPQNPRIIKDDKFKKLVQSLKDFPEMMNIRPVVVNKEMMILGGNMRYEAAKAAGWKEIPIEVTDLSEEKQKEFIIKDNISGGEWDYDLLANEWDVKDLSEWGVDLPDDWGVKKEAKEDDYEIPDTIETDIVPGDLFQIGEHRLMCGDSTDSDQVAKLIGGALPVLMVTDPPYGVNYDADWRNHALRKDGSPSDGRAIGKVTNDHNADWKDTYSLFTGNIAYVWHGGHHAKVVIQNLEDCGFEMVAQIIWAKNNIVIGRGDYHFKHEPCIYAVRKGKNHNWNGSRKENSLWEIDKPNKSETGHSTQKPIECMAKPIENNTKENDAVYDPFLGSGTTMVAAHQLNRKCYGIEIDPKYCQVIIDRMKKLDPEIKIVKL